MSCNLLFPADTCECGWTRGRSRSSSGGDRRRAGAQSLEDWGERSYSWTSLPVCAVHAPTCASMRPSWLVVMTLTASWCCCGPVLLLLGCSTALCERIFAVGCSTRACFVLRGQLRTVQRVHTLRCDLKAVFTHIKPEHYNLSFTFGGCGSFSFCNQAVAKREKVCPTECEALLATVSPRPLLWGPVHLCQLLQNQSLHHHSDTPHLNHASLAQRPFRACCWERGVLNNIHPGRCSSHAAGCGSGGHMHTHPEQPPSPAHLPGRCWLVEHMMGAVGPMLC